MNLPARLASMFALMGVLLFSFNARALTWTTTGSYPKRSNFASKTITGLGTSGTFDKDAANAGINRADCVDTSQNWDLYYDPSSVGSADFVEVWVTTASDTMSAACDTPCARGAGGDTSCAKTCFRVATFRRDQVVGVTAPVSIYPYQIVGALNGHEATTTASLAPDQAPVACTPSGPNSESIAIVLWSVPLQHDQIQLAASNTSLGLQTAYDIAGPGAPSNATVKPADAKINIYFDSISTVTYKDLIGIRAYCWPSAGFDAAGIPDTATADTSVTDSATSSDASDTGSDAITPTDTGTASTDTGSSTSTDSAVSAAGCPAGVPFAAGEFPPAGLVECGSAASGVAGKLTTDTLINYQPYAVAVAAYDKFGNSGQLSVVNCTTPREVVDFYDAYKGAGGQGGGGYCAFNGSNTGMYGLGLSGLALALIGRIARRRNDKRNDR